MTDSAPLFVPGTTFGDGGRYTLRRRVGTGGMAEVYMATDSRLGDRVVAVKTLSGSAFEHPWASRLRQLFVQEAQALSRVKDENVVEVLDFGVTDDGTPYMVMEFLHGEDLSALLKRTKQMEIGEAVDLLLGVCAGVHACHLAGIIHRDLKPANIFLSRTLKGRQPKILDFGVAKVLVAERGRADSTRTDLVVGTPSYMSPEQALGRPATELSDQYSMGALLYRILTGSPPRGASPKPRELRPELPADLEGVILRALDPTPENRFPTVHQLGQALLPFASAAGRAPWKTYYDELPSPLDQNTTGSIIRRGNGGRPEAEVASTVAVRTYDFGVHDRTTRVASPGLGGPHQAADLTLVDPSPPRDLESAPTISLSTADILVEPHASMSTGSSAEVPALPSVGKTGSGATERPSYRTRLVAAFASAAMVIVAVTTLGAVHLRGGSASPRSGLVPPGLLRSPTPPLVANVTATGGPRVPTLAPDTKGVAMPLTISEQPPILPEVAIPPAPSTERHRRHRRHEATPDVPSPIEYSADGLPILH